MFRRSVQILGVATLVTSGCVGGPDAPRPGAGAQAAEAFRERMSAVVDSVQRPWAKLTGPEKPDPARRWDWMTAMPTGATRAETVPPTVAGSSLTALIPDFRGPDIRLASVGTSTVFRISAINGTAVNNCMELSAAATQALDSGKKLTISLSAESQPQTASSDVQVAPAQLVALSQAAAPQEQLLRVSADGNPWVLLREEGIRCKVMARAERQRCLMHVAVSLGVCWGSPVTLPTEVQASCDGVPLQCLTVSETLEALYAGQRRQRSSDRRPPESYSFQAVSEREDYLLPTNYRRLQQAVDEAAKASVSPPGLPALATLPGLRYPGPAVLGDARALAGFLLQRQIYQPGEPERIGWLIFSGDELGHGRGVQVTIDLGQGPHQLVFSLPNP